MTPARKSENYKVFRSQDAFYRYIEQLNSRGGYVLVETAPLLKSKKQNNVSLTAMSDPGSRKG